MKHSAKSIRAFIGALDFRVSRSFYHDLGFQESILSDKMSYFSTDGLGFYLQDAYVKDWIDNSMLFMEVDDLDLFWQQLQVLNLHDKYKSIRLIPIRTFDWGRECYLHDPSGVLWHFGQFTRKP